MGEGRPTQDARARAARPDARHRGPPAVAPPGRARGGRPALFQRVPAARRVRFADGAPAGAARGRRGPPGPLLGPPPGPSGFGKTHQGRRLGRERGARRPRLL
eukprot:681615-Pyramimonas_sp.AAC.1